MSKIYVIVDDNFKPFLAYSEYEDAKETVANMFGKSLAQLNRHCYSIPFCDNSKIIDFSNSKDVIDLTINATLRSYEHIYAKFEEMMNEQYSHILSEESDK